MARNAEFYKGSRKKRSHYYVIVAVAVALIALLVVLFYGMQKYAVITKDDVKVELPILGGESTVLAGDTGTEDASFEQTTVSIIFDTPDYSSVQPLARTGIRPVRAIYVPHENLNLEKLEEYANRLQTGNALMLEMKPRSGNLMWYSRSRTSIWLRKSAAVWTSAIRLTARLSR